MIRSRARANMPSPRPVAQRVCHRWQRLVCPERRLYVVTNEAELQSAVPESPAGKARYDLLKNLRQMLEWTSVGNSSGDINDRSGRKNAAPLVSQAGGASAVGRAQAASVASGAARGERVRASLPGYHPTA